MSVHKYTFIQVHFSPLTFKRNNCTITSTLQYQSFTPTAIFATHGPHVSRHNGDPIEAPLSTPPYHIARDVNGV